MRKKKSPQHEEEQTKRPQRRSLVEAAEAQEAAIAARERRSLTEHQQSELAVLVAVEFTADQKRKKLTTAARLARDTAALLAGEDPAAENIHDLDFDASRAEFEELARSAGATIATTIVQRRQKPDPGSLVGQGKLDEIVEIVTSTGASLVLFDHDLTPSQLRNIEARMPCHVIDRSQLILDIFARHARTREGQLQVELAQLEYQLPRLSGRGRAMSQTGGGIGTRGPGETQLETDRRKINIRIDRIKEQLEAVRRIRRQQRQRREAVPVPVVALVGYTNAGKSTLFNALTEAGVLESARMFATLDPKLRQLTLPSRRKILLSDTVGFIRNLPHQLVTSFRATLEEVERAEILLHIQDASSEMRDEQKAQVEKVLAELEVKGKTVLQVLNKIDLVGPRERENLSNIPGDILVSGLAKVGLPALIAAIDDALVVDPLIQSRLRLPQSEGAILASLEAGAVIETKRFEGNLVFLEVRGPASLLNRYRRFRERSGRETEVVA
ncbi:GTP-binding protein HflX [Granulicella pectinivorans]|uniref:GTPase HflX n=1 Tax=Granulicella pectinivorans TaxID=474950 RepID=A0A1I6MPC6_9BACT|nr:GTPase HflX [Granulicella pectinivorans]SFS17428.1 GTP-binding protein HflX [Granulicella pectinivorans]